VTNSSFTKLDSIDEVRRNAAAHILACQDAGVGMRPFTMCLYYNSYLIKGGEVNYHLLPPI
jgi:hypothetical protein